MTVGVSHYGKVIEGVGEEVLKKIFGHESDDLPGGRRKWNNEKHRAVEIFVGKLEGNGSPGSHNRKFQDNIKMSL